METLTPLEAELLQVVKELRGALCAIRRGVPGSMHICELSINRTDSIISKAEASETNKSGRTLADVDFFPRKKEEGITPIDYETLYKSACERARIAEDKGKRLYEENVAMKKQLDKLMLARRDWIEALKELGA